MPFHFVVSTNTGAIALWERIWFDAEGPLHRAFARLNEGLVDALIMYQEL